MCRFRSESVCTHKERNMHIRVLFVRLIKLCVRLNLFYKLAQVSGVEKLTSYSYNYPTTMGFT